MDPKEIRTLQLLEEIEKNQMPSQRQLAGTLNISLGLVNSFVKRLAQKGFFKITHVPKNRLKYILTPKGIAEKSRLTYEYITGSFDFYKRARKKLRSILLQLEANGVQYITFYGVSELSEIAFLSLQETRIRLTGVVDAQKVGKKFFGFVVEDPEKLKSLTYDKILITAIESTDTILDNLSGDNISSEVIVRIRW
jgi:DNA-binding MarR family transcriptional regulator